MIMDAKTKYYFLMNFFDPLPMETSKEDLINFAIPDIMTLIGSKKMAEVLGVSVKNGRNGSINAHIMINARITGCNYKMSKEQAKTKIKNWIKNNNLDRSDEDVGMAFLREVIAEIID